jgi:hypothetical protein
LFHAGGTDASQRRVDRIDAKRLERSIDLPASEYRAAFFGF